MSLRAFEGVIVAVVVVAAGGGWGFGTPHGASRGNLSSFPGVLGQRPSLDGH
jgi:hypothetical protein